jgi:hemerythrin-like metal-binding protein
MTMALLRWKDHYSVGIEDIDHEHRDLIEQINQIYEQLLISEPRGAPAFFDDMIKAISGHFALEERFMRERGYDQLPQHKEDHERLLDEILCLIDNFDRDDEMAGREDLSARLDAWLSRHFETHDARLHGAFGPHPE